VTLTASVKALLDATPSSELPALAGTVEFFDGKTSLGVVDPGADGTATLTTSALTAGRHFITAKYSGDAAFVFGARVPLLACPALCMAARTNKGEPILRKRR
jgi:hypothetical protein